MQESWSLKEKRWWQIRDGTNLKGWTGTDSPCGVTSQALPWGSVLGSVRYTSFTDNTKNHIHFMLDQTGCHRTSGLHRNAVLSIFQARILDSVCSKLSIVRDHCFASFSIFLNVLFLINIYVSAQKVVCCWAVCCLHFVRTGIRGTNTGYSWLQLFA